MPIPILAAVIALIGPAANAPAFDDDPPKASVAAEFRAIVAEYEAEQKAANEAADAAPNEAQGRKILGKMSPNDAAYSGRMVELAKSSPGDPASRDALIWVINKTYRKDHGEYGDQVAIAVRMLVDRFADDPEAVRAALRLNNTLSGHRDALMDGFYAGATSHEAKGLARLAMARYLEVKARLAEMTRDPKFFEPIPYDDVDDDGKPVRRTYNRPAEEVAYLRGLRLFDPGALRSEAERLFNEVIDEYGDLPYIDAHHRRLEALLKEPVPMWNFKPMTADEIDKVRAVLDRRRTLAEVAEGHLDEMHNLAVGKPAPEIDAADIDGKPMKLADYRGKVVVLSFWGSWCGPCMGEVPHERALVEKYTGRPFALLGVDCNEPASAAKKAMADNGMTWPQWHDGEEGDGPIVEKYHIRKYPTIFVIGPDGIIRHKDVRGEALEKAVDDLMEKP